MVKKRRLNIIIYFIFCVIAYAQNEIQIKAHFSPEDDSVSVRQTIIFKNSSAVKLTRIYLQDWNHSYSDNATPLAKRFAEEFNPKFHFSKNKDKGKTFLRSIVSNQDTVRFKRLENQIDIIALTLEQPLEKGDSIRLDLNYSLLFPSTRFNRFGSNSIKELQLKNWFISPAVFDGTWQFYSNKDLDDQFTSLFNIALEVSYPESYAVHTAYNTVQHVQKDSVKITKLAHLNSLDQKLYFSKRSKFYEVETDKFTLVSNIRDEGISKVNKSLLIDKIAFFLDDKLGSYPHQRIFITEEEYRRNPIYGLNQLPSFVRPFPNGFQYELKIVKTLTAEYLDNTLHINKRKDYWIKDAIQIYLLMDYVATYYPELHLLGSFSKIWGIKSFHAAKLKFNDQYNFLALNMARLQLDQPLTMAKDSLIKFNNNIASKYKAALGLQYLDDYLNDDIIDQSIKDFYNDYKLKPTRSEDFLHILENKTDQDISWFYSDYINSRKNIDYKLVAVEEKTDSLIVTIKNKTNSKVPIALYSTIDDKTVHKIWISGLTDTQQITIPNVNQTKVVLNKEQLIVDVNQGNNTKKLKGFSVLNKPFQLRFFQDIEDPNYSQIFFIPELGFNAYDGFSPGIKLYNKTFLKKPLEYKIKPMYGLRSKELIGGASARYTLFDKFSNNYALQFGVSGSTFHYEEDLSYTRFSSSISLLSRDQNNLRSNKNEAFNIRYITVLRDRNPTILPEDSSAPDYSVLNLRYVNSNRELATNLSWFSNAEIAKKFGKISLNFSYKKLFKSKRQINLRYFAGAFIYNKEESNYFDFALDRPTDYLFDYDYYGRSEDTGIYSQQLIIAEGGFKSKLTPSFANQWITTLNASTTLWNYIHAYGDIGLVKNKNIAPEFVYDAGVRLNLVENYFELYFPVYSNLGWEISQSRYSEKIRFIVTLSPKTLLKLFTRKWY